MAIKMLSTQAEDFFTDFNNYNAEVGINDYTSFLSSAFL